MGAEEHFAHALAVVQQHQVEARDANQPATLEYPDGVFPSSGGGGSSSLNLDNASVIFLTVDINRHRQIQLTHRAEAKIVRVQPQDWPSNEPAWLLEHHALWHCDYCGHSMEMGGGFHFA